jgi:hypothetical protein
MNVILLLFVFADLWAFGGHVEQQQSLPFDSMAHDTFISMILLLSRAMLFNDCHWLSRRMTQTASH